MTVSYPNPCQNELCYKGTALRPNYQPESFSSRADNGRGLILRAISHEIICEIICLSHIPIHCFNAFDIQKCNNT